MRRHHLLVLSVVAGLAGCQTDLDPTPSEPEALTLSDAAASAVAGDLSGRLAEQEGSAHKSLRFASDGSSFAIALEAALKGWGFELANDQDPRSDGKKAKMDGLVYSATAINGQVFAALATDTVSVSRIYAVTADSAVPESPLTVMKRN